MAEIPASCRSEDLEEFESGRCVLIRLNAVEVVGLEAGRYLQGQLTQDIDQIEVGRAGWSFLLEPDGKVVAFVRVVRVEAERFLLIGDPTSADAIESRLRRFMIRVKASVSVVPVWMVSSLADDDQVDAGIPLPTLSARLQDSLFESVPSVEGFQDTPAVLIHNTWTALNGIVTSSDVAAGSNPFEYGVDILSAAVSFTKGCYTGQELVARVDARGGTAPFRILGIESGVRLTTGESLEVDGAVVGTVIRVGSGSDMVTRGLARIARKIHAGSVIEIVGREGTARVFDLPSQRSS
ncbi:MAG: hypothetical protein WCI12_05620 [Actinomycetes bacterium]